MTLVAVSNSPTIRISGSRLVHFGKMAGISVRLFQAQRRDCSGHVRTTAKLRQERVFFLNGGFPSTYFSNSAGR
jgi:hypothetical protein